MELFKIKHSCGGESKEYTYEEISKHLNEFQCERQNDLTCKYTSCSKQESMAVNSLEDHYRNECTEFLIRCAYCKKDIARKDYNDLKVHDCRKALVQMTEELEKTFKEKEKKLEKDEKEHEEEKARAEELEAENKAAQK